MNAAATIAAATARREFVTRILASALVLPGAGTADPFGAVEEPGKLKGTMAASRRTGAMMKNLRAHRRRMAGTRPGLGAGTGQSARCRTGRTLVNKAAEPRVLGGAGEAVPLRGVEQGRALRRVAAAGREFLLARVRRSASIHRALRVPTRLPRPACCGPRPAGAALAELRMAGWRERAPATTGGVPLPIWPLLSGVVRSPSRRSVWRSPGSPGRAG